MTYADTAAVWGFVIPKPFATGMPAAFGSFIKTVKQRVGNGVQGRGLDFEGQISWVCNTWQPVYPNSSAPIPFRNGCRRFTVSMGRDASIADQS